MEFAEVTYVERVDHAALLRRTFKLRIIVAFIHAFINDVVTSTPRARKP